MRSISRWVASASVGVLGILCTAAAVGAQTAPALAQPVGRIASLTPGLIEGVVLDEHGQPISGAMVSALGATSAFAVTDRSGRFVLRTLSPGPYLVRAHSSGFVASHGEIVEVHPSGRSSSKISLHRAADEHPLLAASLGPVEEAPAPGPAVVDGPGDEDHSETAWRLRHVRRGVLKDAVVPEGMLADAPDDEGAPGPMAFLGRAASSFFTAAPLSGQLNLLAIGSFDSPLQLFSGDGIAHNVAYVSVGSAVGSSGDWAMRGAITQGDISSWIVAGTYSSRAASPHHYEVGLTYAAQRYGTGTPTIVQDVTDASRSAGAVYAVDTRRLTRTVSLTYGGRYARYDYLKDSGLISPHVSVTVAPAGTRTRISGLVSYTALAPGAEEFLPPADDGVWLPPQRTFSSLQSGEPLQAEHTTHGELSLEQDLSGTTTVSFRAFRQHVDDQLVTMFDLQVPGAPQAGLGHYLVGNSGRVDAIGWGAGFRTVIAGHVHGSIEYTETRANWNPAGDVAYLLLVAPSAVRLEHDRIHDISTAVETELPETATRVMVLYRISDGFARGTVAGERPGFDSRFDVQVRQSLPFMNFNNARWEMLVGVRDFFRATSADQSVYDELLVVRPPKRIVGGLTLKF
jgi:hypothetical protein